MAPEMFATVAICTYNRANLLPKALESIYQQTIPTNNFEILIIDNASTDNTREIVQAYQAKHSHMRYVVEPKRGSACARNRAIKEALGEYIAFLDDDACASPNWLAYHLNAWRMGYQAVSGKVELDWKREKPSWLAEEHERLLCHYDLGPEDRDLISEYLITANASFSKKLLKEIGGFDESLGHRGRVLIGGEDNDIFQKVVSRKIPVRYLSKAVVTHIIAEERLTRRWFIKRMFWAGMSIGYLNYRNQKPPLRRLIYDAKETFLSFLKFFFAGQRKSCWPDLNAILTHSGRFYAELLLFFR